jgi:hypothetical protein
VYRRRPIAAETSGRPIDIRAFSANDSGPRPSRRFERGDSVLGFVYSQRFWPGRRDHDDCWVLASLQAAHAVAPWLPLVGVKAFRRAAGKPDDPLEPDPGDERDMARGLQTLYPNLAVEALSGVGWRSFRRAVESGRPAAVILRASALPADHQFGFTGIHAITVAFEGGAWLHADPLAAPHSKPLPIERSAVRIAIRAFEPKVHAVLMPTEADALRTHPLLV